MVSHVSHASHVRVYTYIYIYIHIHTYIQAGRQTYRHTDIQTYIHTGRQAGRQADIQTYRHTDIHTYVYIYIHIRININIRYIYIYILLYMCVFGFLPSLFQDTLTPQDHRFFGPLGPTKTVVCCSWRRDASWSF